MIICLIPYLGPNVTKKAPNKNNQLAFKTGIMDFFLCHHHDQLTWSDGDDITYQNDRETVPKTETKDGYSKSTNSEIGKCCVD
jgi:hypothetical protein